MARNAKKFLEELLGEPMSFAMLLRSIRTRDNLTQKNLADKLDLTVSHISDLENGRKFVSVERASAFAYKLKEPERHFVTLALQDQLNQTSLKYKVKIF